jgi:hypothetical protein
MWSIWWWAVVGAPVVLILADRVVAVVVRFEPAF